MIKRYLMAGLLVWAPIWITFLVIDFLLDVFDRVTAYIPADFRPETLLGFRIPGIGLLIVIIILFLTGMFVTNVFGRYLVGLGEKVLAKIPLVRSIYNGVKKVLQTVLSTTGDRAFRKVLLVRYPHSGTWTIAFQTAVNNGEIRRLLGEDTVTVYVPTTPNPTSGYVLIVPAKDVIELKMSVDEALKWVISLGVIQ
jgi:uncharacterized membrane protein